MNLNIMSLRELKDLEEKILLEVNEYPENASLKASLNAVQSKIYAYSYERSRLQDNRYSTPVEVFDDF